VKAREFYKLLNKEVFRTLLHSPLVLAPRESGVHRFHCTVYNIITLTRALSKKDAIKQAIPTIEKP